MVKRLMFLFIVVILSFSMKGEKAMAADPTVGTEPMIRVENQQITNGYFTNLNNKIDSLHTLDEGTIIIRFRFTGSSIMTLFSLSNNEENAEHFNFYISPSAVGSENRKDGKNIHVSSNLFLKEGKVYTIAMVVDREEGYKYFLDGKLIKLDTQSERKFLSNIANPNSAQLGRTERAAGGNQYLFSGDIDFAEIYSEPLSDAALETITGETAVGEPVEVPLPEGVHVSDPYSVFYPGFMDSNNYRIPALLYTEKGTLIAGIDRRVEHGGDSPNNIDAVIRRSLDEGKTWEEDGIIINDYPDQASNIDISLLQDQTNERIFALVDGWPDGAGLMGGFGTNSYKGSGFKTIDGKKYMYLLDADKKEYTIREDGIIYDDAGEETEYSTDIKRNLYKNGEKVDHIFSATSPVKAFKTSYLELYYSDDEGKNWTGPIELNGQVKEDWMIFLGTGPGNGIQLTEGENKGRLVFPVYFLNDHNRQASAVIYSDDHGVTWHRGESPNEGRNVGDGIIINEKDFTNTAHEITESQVVEMPDGQLKLFMRNYSGRAQIATSFDGGETWHPEVVTERDLVAPYSQMSAIRYKGQIDGKEAVIFSSANNPSSRFNGTVRIGLIEEAGTDENGRIKYAFSWKYDQLVKEGAYGYSSLTNLANGDIGLFYEGTSNTEMDFIKFNTNYIKWEKEKETLGVPEIVSYKFTANQEDKLQVEIEFADYVMFIGSKSLKGKIGEHEINFNLLEKTGPAIFTFEAEIPDLSSGNYTLEVEIADDFYIYNVHGQLLDRHSEAAKLTETIQIGSAEISIQSLQNKIDSYIESEDLTGPLVNQLKNRLKQAEKHINKGQIDQAVKKLHDFIKHIDNGPMQRHISDEAKADLKTDAETLIADWTN